jgi:hypothetical protein
VPTGARSFFASFAVLVSGLACAGPATDALQVLESARSEADVARAERIAAPLWGARGPDWGEGDWRERRAEGLRELRPWAVLEREPKGEVKDPSASVRTILRNPAFRDQGGTQDRTWAGNVGDGLTQFFQRILDWLAELIARLLPRFRGPSGGPAMSGLAPVVWGIAGLGLAVLLFVFIRGYRRVRR